MDVQEINQVVRDVFGNTPTEVVGNWVSMRCPLSQWTHERGRDRRASAGISIQKNSVSVFNCFTCGNKMPIHGMLRKYAKFSGEDLDGLIEELEEDAYLGPRRMPGWEEREGIEEELTPLPKHVYLDLYDPAAGHPYLEQRGISDETANKLQLMVDPADPADGEERILFPVFGHDGELYGLSGRATNPGATLKVRDYFGLRKAANLLGAHLIDPKVHTHLIVVEGLFDYANSWEQGQPAVAVMHSTLTPRQARLLREIGMPTYLFYDDDTAGQKGVITAGDLLYEYLPVMKVKYPTIWIEDETEEEGGHYVKDPGELLADDFASMIRGARLYFPEHEKPKTHQKGRAGQLRRGHSKAW